MRKNTKTLWKLFALFFLFSGELGYCKLNPPPSCGPLAPILKAVKTYPKKNFLETAAWLSKPIPSPDHSPFWIISAEYKKSGEEQDVLLNLNTGERLTLPSPMDLVGTPDGKFFTVPGTYSGGKGILFYSASQFLKTLRTKGEKGIQALKPLYQDSETQGHHSVFGTLKQKNTTNQKKGVTLYRTLLGGGGPFQLIDYEVSESKTGPQIKRKIATPLCANLPYFEDNGSATLSKDGRFTALFDTHERAVIVYELSLKRLGNPAGEIVKSFCKEVANTHTPAGKVDFSPDGKWLVLHVPAPLSHPEDFNLANLERKEMLLIELKKDQEEIIGLGVKTRILLTEPQTANAFFPSFLPNGLLFFIREYSFQEKQHRFEVIDPKILMTPRVPCIENKADLPSSSLPVYCKLEPHNAKVLYAYPQDKNHFLESIAWMARPFPNNAGRPLLIGYAEFMEDGLERNFLLDLATGEKLTVPGQGDPVATPDGKYLSIPGLNEGSKGLTFYEAKPFFEALKKNSKTVHHLNKIEQIKLKPIFNDPEINGYCQSFGITFQDKIKTRYRTIHSRGGAFQLTEYQATAIKGKTHFERLAIMPLCGNLTKPEEHGTASISKDGTLISLFDFASNSTKLYTLEVKNGQSYCQELLDLGLPTGALDFSYDGNKIAFHITFLDIDYGDNTSLGVPSTKIKDVILAELTKKDGKITGLGKMTRLTTSLQAGEGSYFPSFFSNGKLFYLHHDRRGGKGDRYRFEVIDPRDARYELAPFAQVPTQEFKNRLLSKIVLGRLWLKSCQKETLTPTQSALYALSLKPQDCEKMVRTSWELKKMEILSELKSTDTNLNWKAKGFDQMPLDEKLNAKVLLKACQKH